MPIRKLSKSAIDRIAAGEIIDRPSSVIKELVENSIDSSSTQIKIITESSGKKLIKVIDNGHGMLKDDLLLSVKRHCTSKLDENDLENITTLGFRGEALPSIGAVSKLTVETRYEGEDHGWKIEVANGREGQVRPTATPVGTIVTVQDLFSEVPARLKFLKTDKAENILVHDTVKRLALATPKIHYTVKSNNKITLDLHAEVGDTPLLHRASKIIGDNFIENSVAINISQSDITLIGYASLPTQNRAQPQNIYCTVNGRPVRDKMLLATIRYAYRDVIMAGRYPIVVLEISVDPRLIDVNTHPTKAEVRFHNAKTVRKFIANALTNAVGKPTIKTYSTISTNLLKAFRPQVDIQTTISSLEQTEQTHGSDGMPEAGQLHIDRQIPIALSEPIDQALQTEISHTSNQQNDPHYQELYKIENEPNEQQKLLGVAKAQLHDNFIISQTINGMIIVDSHAAHERIIYEKLKAQLYENGIARQILLIPEVVDLASGHAALICENAATLKDLGLVVEEFGPTAVLVREVPNILCNFDVANMIQDLAEDIIEYGDSSRVSQKIDAILSVMACHGSVRTGRKLHLKEMNALLRSMESVQNTGQCNHGRPTFISLNLNDIKSLFKRKNKT